MVCSAAFGAIVCACCRSIRFGHGRNQRVRRGAPGMTRWPHQASYATMSPMVHNHGANIGFVDGHAAWWKRPNYAVLPVYYYE